MSRSPRAQAPNRPGVHFLRSTPAAERLVRSVRLDHTSLVLDLGAGAGAVTAPLAATGATVLAVERNPDFVRRLRTRFAAEDKVRVIHADVLAVPLPRRPYAVVASIPFAVSTQLLRRLLSPPDSRLTSADLIVEWGMAKRLTEQPPRSPETALWSAVFELTLCRRVPAGCFQPAPAVDAAHLAIRRRHGLSRDAVRLVRRLVRDASTDPDQPARGVVAAFVGRRRAGRLLTTSGIDPPAPAGVLTVDQWLALASAIASDR